MASRLHKQCGSQYVQVLWRERQVLKLLQESRRASFTPVNLGS